MLGAWEVNSSSPSCCLQTTTVPLPIITMAGTLLPTELLLLAVSNVEMLESMFPLAHELEISPSSVGPLGLLRDVSAELESDPAPQATLASLASSLPYDLRLLLHLILDDQPKYPLAIELVLPLRTSPTGSPAVGSLVVRPPAWMSRSSFMSLSETLPPCVQGEVLDNVLALVDHLREEGPRFIPPPTPEPVLGGGVDVEPDENGIDRVWMWLCVPPTLYLSSEDNADSVSERSFPGRHCLPSKSGTTLLEWLRCGSSRASSSQVSVIWAPC